MLTSTFKLMLSNKAHITLCHIECVACTNIFFVPAIGENEPVYCAYCGVKFVSYVKDDNEQHYNLSGQPIDKDK